jgi:hypothetical protein
MEITFTFKDCLTIFNNYYLRVNNGQLISEGLIIEDRCVTMGKTHARPRDTKGFGLSAKY